MFQVCFWHEGNKERHPNDLILHYRCKAIGLKFWSVNPMEKIFFKILSLSLRYTRLAKQFNKIFCNDHIKKLLTSWFSFVMSNCEVVTFPLVSWVSCGAWLYWFLIFAFFTFNEVIIMIYQPKKRYSQRPRFDLVFHLIFIPGGKIWLSFWSSLSGHITKVVFNFNEMDIIQLLTSIRWT